MTRKLSLLFAGTLLFGFAQAQDFTITPKVVEGTTTGVDSFKDGDDYHNYVAMETEIKNISKDTLSLTWTNITDETTNPEEWILVGVCDNTLCRFEYGEWYYGKPERTNVVEPNTSFMMQVHIYAPNNGSNGTGIYKIKISTENQTDTIEYKRSKEIDSSLKSISKRDKRLSENHTDTIVYMLTKEQGSSVKAISIEDKSVFIYPNPAAQDIKVYADPALKGKQMNIINMVGCQLMKVPINSNREVAEVNIASLAPGMYILQIAGENGKIVTSRKFIKK